MSRSASSDGRPRLVEVDAPVQVGELVAQKYRIEGMIAVGGMGLVAAARHEILGQRVAIKFLLSRPGADDAVPRFLREARAAARIHNPHVVHVFDCGELDSGIPFMVMEHLEGVELSREMKSRGAFPVREAVDIIMDVIEGVAAAHALGVVHRDLKPSNLFLVDEPGGGRCVKVLDFGISKLQTGETVEDDLTRSMVLGSPRYISPEQAQSSRDVDTRTDIWSIGVILYQMIAGEAPFQGDTVGQLVAQILLHTPERLDRREPTVPAELADAVARCLQRDREERFGDVAELARALAPFGSARARLARIEGLLQLDRATEPRVAETETEPPPSVGTVGSWTQNEGGERRASRMWIAGVAVALAVGSYAGWRWQDQRGRTPASPPPVVEAPKPPPIEPRAAQPEKRPAEPEPSAAEPEPAPSASAAPASRPVVRPVVRPPPPPPTPLPAPPPRDVLQHSD